MNPVPQFQRMISLRWADIDPNFHLRHSCYYDFGAQFRMQVLEELGITLQVMQHEGFGPILFREECVFKREIRFQDVITIDVELCAAREDRSRWSFRHRFTRADGTLCAVLTVDGAWMDTRLRKLAVPPALAIEGIDKLPRSEDFRWT